MWLRFAAVVVPGMLAAAAGPPPGIPASRVSADPAALTPAAASALIQKQTGLTLDPGDADPVRPHDLTWNNLPFWAAVEDLAARTNTRVAVEGGGKRIRLATGPAGPSHVEGAFRVSAKGVTARTDADTGRTTYDLAVELAWEPRFPVFRADAQPKITSATDDRGTKLTAPAPAVKAAVSGFTHSSMIRLDGLSRQSTAIAEVRGSFIVTAAPKMLSLAFDDVAGPPPFAKSAEGVTAKIVRLEKDDDRWEIDFDLGYPDAQPEFESFESWASGNTLKLVAPKTGKVYAPDSYDLAENSRRVKATYRFKAAGGPDLTDRAGWRFVYETPAPLVEFAVPFVLKNIPLP